MGNQYPVIFCKSGKAWFNMVKDTIAAIATAMSDSGIGIIRISGREAVDACNNIFRTKSGKMKIKELTSHRMIFGYIVDMPDSGTVNEEWTSFMIDEVMAVVMKAPNSYTAEDTVEIQCHGGVLVMQKILELILKQGVRLAQPGEFTKRAFLNGRIDLSRAEAVMDVIHAGNELALASSVKQLRGNVSEAVGEIRDEILYEIAFIESALDDPEHISLEGYEQRLRRKLESLMQRTGKLISSADNGKLMKEGIQTVIVGKPNAGKSSLLNLLVGEERAIVTDIAGTTRDVLQESIRLHGIGLNIVDTAGIRSTQDVVERIGVEKAKKYAADADLILYVADASVPLDENDDVILSMIGEKNTVILLNKTDLPGVVDEDVICRRINEVNVGNVGSSFEPDDSDIGISEDHKAFAAEVISQNVTLISTGGSGKEIRIIRTSTRENVGMDVFEDTVKKMFFQGEIKADGEITITNMRHKEALMEAHESLNMVIGSLDMQMPEDFYSIDLMSAYGSLGRILGEEVGEDLVNEIFSKFCMGK